jgi:hypothetical protein
MKFDAAERFQALSAVVKELGLESEIAKYEEILALKKN